MSAPRTVRAPRGPDISCLGWPQEAALRMLMNNLDPEVAERPQDLVVYGGTGRAARSWDAFHAIVRALQGLEGDETLLIQSGKPVGVFRTQPSVPRVLISNAMLVPKWADWETFWQLEAAGLTMYGQMTAGSWIYIGSQGILQGTYETLAEQARRDGEAVSIGLLGNAAEVFPELLRRGFLADVVTDQTSAHDPVGGYVPRGLSLKEAGELRV